MKSLARLLYLAAFVPAFASAETDEEKFLRLVQENGCSMSEGAAAVVLPKNGLDFEVAEDIFEVWIAQGRAEFDRDTDSIVLGGALCDGNEGQANANAPEIDYTFSEEGMELVVAIRGTGCQMNEEQAMEVLPATGLDIETVQSLVPEWIGLGLVIPDGNTLILSDGLCNAHGIDVSNTEARKAAFIAVIERNGCQMSEEVGSVVLPDAGFEDRSETSRIVAELMSFELAALDGSVLTLSTDNCQN